MCLGDVNVEHRLVDPLLPQSRVATVPRRTERRGFRTNDGAYASSRTGRAAMRQSRAIANEEDVPALEIAMDDLHGAQLVLAARDLHDDHERVVRRDVRLPRSFVAT
jgi:hypothetical protein